jgi:hypothetical protein
MTPEAQRIAIAKLRGWTQHAKEIGQCYDPHGLLCSWDDAPYFLDDPQECLALCQEMLDSGFSFEAKAGSVLI